MFNLLNPLPSSTYFCPAPSLKTSTGAGEKKGEGVAIAHHIFGAIAIRAGMVREKAGSTARRSRGLFV